MKSDCLDFESLQRFSMPSTKLFPEAYQNERKLDSTKKCLQTPLVIFMVKRQKFLSFYEQSSSSDGNTLAHGSNLSEVSNFFVTAQISAYNRIKMNWGK